MKSPLYINFTHASKRLLRKCHECEYSLYLQQ